jgi:NAD(P)-dependent dehydrogenase (short-subunit alcohol dehydrogenase family)
MLIEKSCLQKDCLKGKTVLVTGGGGGIGYETVRALVRLGAEVIIAEIDEEKGAYAEKTVNKELTTDRAHFYKIDLSDEAQIELLCRYITDRFGFVDVIFNNATVTPFGAAEEVDIGLWDKSYAVNLRAPVLLLQHFLPEMKKQNKGTIVFVPSSGAAPFMGAYEVFKTAQVELCNTLAGELEGTEIVTYSIGPGLVKTETAQRGIEVVVRRMGISTEEFYQMNESKMLDAESAGTGFAISVALAAQYNGQEIGSIQALIDAKVFAGQTEERAPLELDEKRQNELKAAMSRIIKTYHEQYDGWLKRNVFERQWILRDFKKTVGMPVDDMKKKTELMSYDLQQNDLWRLRVFKSDLKRLKTYYERQYMLLQGYEKNPQKLRENSDIIISWLHDIESVLNVLE